MEGEITADSLNQYYEDFKAGKLVKKTKSEPIPESQDEPVTKIVAL